MELHIIDLEERGIVEQRTVYTSLVGALDVAELHITRLERLLGTEVCKHTGILDLAHSDNGATHIGEHVGTHIGKRLGHILQFMRIFQAVPTVTSIGKKFKIAFAFIMDGVKEVLLIVEANSVNQQFLLS